jgi:NADH-quinone oxidoreductase subunit E
MSDSGNAQAQLDVHGRPVKTELGPDERAKKREKIVDTLWEIQQRQGWIDDAALERAAAECALSPAEADEVATFYNLLFRRPVGKRVIFVCDSISCELTGGIELMDGLCAELGIRPGETTPDGEFTILPIVCLGHCEKAPCCLAGETVHGPLATDRQSVQGLVAKIRAERKGEGR